MGGRRFERLVRAGEPARVQGVLHPRQEECVGNEGSDRQAGPRDAGLPRRYPLPRVEPRLDGAAGDSRGRPFGHAQRAEPHCQEEPRYPRSPGQPGRSWLDRLGQSLDEELQLHAAAAARSRERARTRQVHLPERALRVPARHAEQRGFRRRSAHVQLGVHPRREPARFRLGAARARRLDPRTRAGGHRCRRFPDRPAESAACRY